MAGEVVHLEFPSEDADRAAGFWNGLFGWEFGESEAPGMDYRMARVSEKCGAAVFPHEERSGFPTMYLDTEDIEKSIAQVLELGGHAEEKAPVPGHGWFAACKDTEGNSFHLWQADESAAPAGGEAEE